MTLRLLWLIFALLVVVLVFVPIIVAADELWICEDHVCYMHDSVFQILLDLARKCSKGCA